MGDEENLVMIDESMVGGRRLKESMMRIVEGVEGKKIVMVWCWGEVGYGD